MVLQHPSHTAGLALLLLCVSCAAARPRVCERGLAFGAFPAFAKLRLEALGAKAATPRDSCCRPPATMLGDHARWFGRAAVGVAVSMLLGVPSGEWMMIPGLVVHAEGGGEAQQEDRLLRKMRCKSGASTDDSCYDSLVAKLRSPDRDAPPAQAPSADGRRYGGGKSMDELKRNKRLILEAWDVIHRGGRGYPGWFDPNGGFYVDPTTFLLEDRNKWVSVEDNYKTQAAAHDTITQMVADLHDPYSRFLTRAEARSEEAPPSPLSKVNMLVGVGLQLFDPLDGNEDLVVVAPLPESPAERAGIKPLDRVTRIDGVDVGETRLTADEALATLRGREGSSVEVVIRKARNSAGAVRDSDDVLADRLPRLVGPLKRAGEVDEASLGWWKGVQEPPVVVKWLTRTPLNIPPVRAGLIDAGGGESLGYIRVNFFNHRGTQMLAEAVRTLEERGVRGYVIDTRNCLGGQFGEALLAATMFVEDEGAVLVSLMDANGVLRPKQVEWQVDRYRWPDTGGRPLDKAVGAAKAVAILTNRGSASSSEVLTLALAGNRPTIVVGERTFGKALVQHPYRLADGSVIKLTVAEYLSPRARHVGTGIYPDLLCTDSPGGEAGDPCARLAGAQVLQAARARAGGGGQAALFVNWGAGGGAERPRKGGQWGGGVWKYQGLTLESPMSELNEARRGREAEGLLSPWGP